MTRAEQGGQLACIAIVERKLEEVMRAVIVTGVGSKELATVTNALDELRRATEKAPTQAPLSEPMRPNRQD